MANIKSQIKRNRQNEKRRVRNRVFRGEARTAIRDARVAIEAGDAGQSGPAVLQAIRNLDLAVQQGVLHRNNAARRKSRLVKALARMEPKEVKARVEAEPVVEVEEPKKGRKAAKSAAPAPKEKKAAKPSPKEKKEAKRVAAATKKTAPKKPAAASAPKGKKAAPKPAAKAKKPAAKAAKKEEK